MRRIRLLRAASWAAIGAVLVGVFSTWTSAGPLTLNGVEGPNDGWLVVIVALLALVWVRLMVRGSWIGVAGVLGSAAVIFWTAVEDWRDARAVLDASVGHGLLLVVTGSVVLAVAAIVQGVEIVRSRPARP